MYERMYEKTSTEWRFDCGIYFHSKSDISCKCKKATYDLQEQHLYLFVSLGVVVEVSDSARVERGTPPDDSVNLATNCLTCEPGSKLFAMCLQLIGFTS